MEHFKINPTNPSQPQPRQCDPAWIAERIQILFSAYRKDDYNDPAKFVAQLGMNLERFPPEIVEYVTDPMTGLQTRSKWPPSLAEVIEACRAEQAHREKVAKYSAMGPVLRLPRPRFSLTESYEAMVRKHGRPIGVFENGRELPYGG